MPNKVVNSSKKEERVPIRTAGARRRSGGEAGRGTETVTPAPLR